ncbi:MAG: DMT family transporter [Colwellia sp.]
MSSQQLVELLTLAAIWGASFMFMRVGSPEFGPILFMALRTLIASVFLLPLVFIAKKQASFKGYKLKIFIMGIFNTAIPFVLFGYAILSLSGGITSILNATTPMFGAIVAYLWFREKLTAFATFGLCIGFIGVYFLMFDKLQLNQGNVLLPTLAAMLASLCYGFAANYTKKYLSGISSIVLASGSQVAATCILLPISLFFIPTEMPSVEGVTSVILLGVLCTGVAYIIFFRLIANLGPSKAISVTYLIPAFGLFWGHLFLDEKVTFWMLVGCGFILLGVALATGLIKPRKNKLT